MTTYFLIKNGVQSGPFTADVIQERVNDGSLSEAHSYAYTSSNMDDLDEWHPLSELVTIPYDAPEVPDDIEEAEAEAGADADDASQKIQDISNKVQDLGKNVGKGVASMGMDFSNKALDKSREVISNIDLEKIDKKQLLIKAGGGLVALLFVIILLKMIFGPAYSSAEDMQDFVKDGFERVQKNNSALYSRLFDGDYRKNCLEAAREGSRASAGLKRDLFLLAVVLDDEDACEYIIEEMGYSPTSDDAALAAQFGKLDLLKYLSKQGVAADASHISLALINHQQDVLEYLVEDEMLSPVKGDLEIALCVGNMKGFKYVVKSGLSISRKEATLIALAIGNDNASPKNVLSTLKMTDPKIDLDDVVDNQFDCFEYLVEKYGVDMKKSTWGKIPQSCPNPEIKKYLSKKLK